MNNRRDVMMSILAEVARNYMEPRGNQRRLEIARRNVANQQGTFDIVRSRVENGLSSNLDQTLAEAQLKQTQALAPGISAETRTLTGLIALYKSLGGGWEAFE